MKLMIEEKAGLSLTKTKPLFSSKSRRIFVGYGCDVKIFNAASGICENKLKGHKTEVISICEDPSCDDSIVSCDNSGTAIFWNENSHKEQVFTPKKGSYVSHFILISRNEYIVGCQFGSEAKTAVLYYCRKGKKESYLVKDVLLGPNMVSVNEKNDFLCAAREDSLFTTYFPFDNIHNIRKHKVPEPLTCVQCHPTQNMVAVGDNIGRITLFYQPDLQSPVRQKLHWHTLPVADLSFTSTGIELVSGGGECVCVEWNMNSLKRKFLPRLGTPILFIAVDRSNDFVVAAHSDNSLSLVNAREFRLEGLIQELSTHIGEIYPKTGRQSVLPAGIHVHPASKSLVMNGRKGHLQFYDFHSNRLLYHLDITMINFACNERKQLISNPDVNHVGISSDSKWMVTCESCQVTSMYIDVKLKFWRFDGVHQRWELSTCVVEPHDSEVTSLSLSSASIEGNDAPTCITCGTDGKVRQWNYFVETHGTETREMWLCTSVEEYLNLIPLCCEFTPDISTVAVAFGNVLTFWETKHMTLLGTFSKSFIDEDIKLLEFSKGSRGGCLIVACTENWLCCWNILSCSLLYRVNLSVSCITSDILSGIIAVFTKEGGAFFFHPSEPTPIGAVATDSYGDIVGAVFVPALDKAKLVENKLWKSNSHLCFVDSKQVIRTIEDGSKVTIKETQGNDIGGLDIDRLLGDSHWSKGDTAFSNMIARTKNDENLNSKKSETSGSKEKVDLEVVSCDTLVKVFSDVQVTHIDSFKALIDKFSSVVPSAPASVIDQRPPQYITIDDESTEKQQSSFKKVRDQIQVSKEVANVDFTGWFNT